MENNFKYFNAFFIIFILIMLMSLFKYFFYENQEKNILSEYTKKKYLNKNYIDHILFIPDNYYFIQMKKIDSFSYEYNLLINKLFSIITETFKYNVATISINLISLTDLFLMSNKEIKNLIDNYKLWELIEDYGNKMNMNINFIYDESIIHSDLIVIFKNIQNKTSSKKNHTRVNFIVGYDLFSDIKKSFIHLIALSESKKDLLYKLKNIDIEKLLLNNIPAVDLAIVFNNNSINDNLLLHMRNSKIIHLNYSLDKITKKMIDLLLKELLINVNPFF